MEVMYVLLPAALVFAVAAVIVFVWATRSGQFDDLETPAMRILGDDDGPPRGGATPQAPGGDDGRDVAGPPGDGGNGDPLDVRREP